MAENLHHLSSFKTIEISGPDAERYLQGRLTQDISLANNTAVRESLLLSPQGKILGQTFFWKLNENFYLSVYEHSSYSVNTFLDELNRFKVADQFETSVSKNKLLFSENKDNSDHPKALATLKYANIGQICIVEDSYSEETGSGQENFLQLLTRHGKALLGRDFDTKATAGNLALDDLVSFSKGCYAGQEVVEKSVALGRVNKKICHLKSKNHSTTPSSEVFLDSNQKQLCGTVTSTASFDDFHYCLASIKAVDSSNSFYIEGKPWSLVSP